MSLSEEQLIQKQAAIAADKANQIGKVVQASTTLQQALVSVVGVLAILQSRGYLKGEDAITEQDLLSHQFTLEEFYKVVALFAELQKFSGGAPVAADAWGLANARIAG